MPKKKDNTSSDYPDSLAFETYANKSTRKSKVPTKIEDARVLHFVAQSIKGSRGEK